MKVDCEASVDAFEVFVYVWDMLYSYSSSKAGSRRAG